MRDDVAICIHAVPAALPAKSCREVTLESPVPPLPTGSIPLTLEARSIDGRSDAAMPVMPETLTLLKAVPAR